MKRHELKVPVTLEWCRVPCSFYALSQLPPHCSTEIKWHGQPHISPFLPMASVVSVKIFSMRRCFASTYWYILSTIQFSIRKWLKVFLQVSQTGVPSSRLAPESVSMNAKRSMYQQLRWDYNLLSDNNKNGQICCQNHQTCEQPLFRHFVHHAYFCCNQNSSSLSQLRFNCTLT